MEITPSCGSILVEPQQAGDPGLGKSQATVSMVAVVSTGGAWPVDGTCCERGNVVILSAEDDPADTIRPRLEAAEADLSRVYILDAVVDGYRGDGGEIVRAFNLKTDLGRLAKLLEEIGDVALIVIDPITAYLGEADSHKTAEIRALLSPLSELAAKHSAAVVCVSHFNKVGGGEALMRVTGSLAFVAAARSVWVVAKDPDNDARRLFLPMKNNIGIDRTGFAFSIQSIQCNSAAGPIETSKVVWETVAVTVTANEVMAPQGDPEERSSTGEALDWLRNILEPGPMKASEVQREARQAGIGEKALRSAREKLGVKPRKREFAGGWWWGLSPAQDAQDAHTKFVGALGN
jgi:AAA domain-containing protein